MRLTVDLVLSGNISQRIHLQESFEEVFLQESGDKLEASDPFIHFIKREFRFGCKNLITKCQRHMEAEFMMGMTVSSRNRAFEGKV